jgi:hypothetical protein
VAAGSLILGMAALHARAAAPAKAQGVITAKGFLNISGTAVTALTGDAKFPDKPDVVYYYPYLEWNATGDISTAPGNYGDNYGDQMVGYFYPPATGNYIFYICSDDNSSLYLSTDDTAANKKLIAQETAYSNPREYTSSAGSSTLTAKDSSQFTGSQWPTKNTITLTAGKAYYIEALHNEGGGGDNCSVAVSPPDGSIDPTLPIPGKYLSSIDKNTGALTITTQPQNVTVDEGQTATFTVVVNGTPPYTYQWQKNGTAITGATNLSYTIARAYRADNGGKFKVAVTGAQGGPQTSGEVTLTVNTDTTGPTLVSASSSATFDSVTVTFSEPVDSTTATAAANYKIDNGVTVSTATLKSAAGTTGDNVVILATSKQPAGTTFTLIVNNVKDVPGNVITANSKITFQSYVFTTGWATYERWDGDTKAIDAFAGAILDGSQGPANVNTAVTQFDGPWNVGDNYNSRHFAWFVAPFTGNYVFFLAADDQANLYLSTDDTPANKKLIAQETGWSNEYQWLTPGTGTGSQKRSDQFDSPEWPTANTIKLTQGNKYYVEILHHEGGGGDGDGATYIKEGDPDPAQSASGMHMLGGVIGTYLDPAGAKLDFTTQPADTTGVDGKTATLRVVANGSSLYGNTVTYQWQKAAPGSSTFTDIAGATLNAYTTPLLTMADSGTKYQVVCGVPALTKASAVATLTVVADTFPPLLVGATAFPGSTKIGVMFDEDLDATSAATAANYVVNGTPVTSAIIRTNVANEKTSEKNLVQLTVPSAVNGDFSLKVTGVKDKKGNAMAATTVTGKILKMTNTDIGSPASEAGGPDPLFPSTVTSWGPGAFDVYCNGNDYWNNADGFNFLWEAKTNSFDVKVRVVSVSPINNWTAGALEIRDGLMTDNGKGWELARHYFVKVDYGGEGVTVLDNSGTGANQYEFNGRLAKGDPTLRETSNAAPGGSVGWGGTGPGNPGPPPYPNAWIRIQRVKNATNDHMIAYTSADGIDWSQRMDVDLNDAGHAGFAGVDGQPAGKWPDVCYVGLGSTSHTGVGNNNQTNDGSVGSFWYSPVGKPYGTYVIYRDYGDVTTSQAPSVGIASGGGKVTITFTGTLQSTTTVTGGWTDVPNATSPYSVTPTGHETFYRAKQ